MWNDPTSIRDCASALLLQGGSLGILGIHARACATACAVSLLAWQRKGRKQIPEKESSQRAKVRGLYYSSPDLAIEVAIAIVIAKTKLCCRPLPWENKGNGYRPHRPGKKGIHHRGGLRPQQNQRKEGFHGGGVHFFFLARAPFSCVIVGDIKGLQAAVAVRVPGCPKKRGAGVNLLRLSLPCWLFFFCRVALRKPPKKSFKIP